MQVTETLNEGLKREIAVLVPAQDMLAKRDEKLVDLKDRVKINGFRLILKFEMVLGSVTDVGLPLMKGYVLVYKIPIDPLITDNFITDGIGHSQVRLGSEDDRAGTHRDQSA